MTSRSQNHDQATAAAAVGISERSTRRIDKDPRFPTAPGRFITMTGLVASATARTRALIAVAGQRAATRILEFFVATTSSASAPRR